MLHFVLELVNLKIENSKQIQNSKDQSPKRYDLEDRTLSFSKVIREYVKGLPKSLTNLEYSRQLIRSSGSIGANYIEANEAVSKREFLFRVKIARKECKETRYWIALTEPSNELLGLKEKLTGEVTELLKIIGTIISRSE